MIRQAHTYLVGAMGGATLIAIAIAVFVVLVSFQVFRDWPIAALGGGEKAAVSEAQPAGNRDGAAATAVGLTAADGAGAPDRARSRSGADGGPTAPAAGGAIAGNPADGLGSTGSTGPDTVGAGGGNQPGSDATGTAPQTTNVTAPAGGGGGAVQSGGGSATGGGGKTSSGGGSEGSGSTPSTAGQVTDTVNNTVNQVDETVLGGTLDKTGVTQVTEGVVNGVAGPESTVGKVVDEAVGAVGGLLGGGKR